LPSPCTAAPVLASPPGVVQAGDCARDDRVQLHDPTQLQR